MPPIPRKPTPRIITATDADLAELGIDVQALKAFIHSLKTTFPSLGRTPQFSFVFQGVEFFIGHPGSWVEHFKEAAKHALAWQELEEGKADTVPQPFSHHDNRVHIHGKC